jgi:hypothetical protein
MGAVLVSDAYFMLSILIKRSEKEPKAPASPTSKALTIPSQTTGYVIFYPKRSHPRYLEPTTIISQLIHSPIQLHLTMKCNALYRRRSSEHRLNSPT